MDVVKQHYTIDLSSNNNFVTVPAMQGDGAATRYVELELISYGQPYEFDRADTLVTIMGSKADGTQIFNTCDVTQEGYILVEITQQMSAVVGKGSYQIALFSISKNSQLKSFPFFVLVTASPFDLDYLHSQNEYQELSNLITQYEHYADEADASAQAAAGSAQAAATSATNAASSAANASTSATNASRSAQEANVAAKTAATDAAQIAATETASAIRSEMQGYTTAAATSATNAATSETKAHTSEVNAATSATNAHTSEVNAATSETNASVSETKAAMSEANANNSATLSESWAVGGTGTRSGENTDNSKYYAQQAEASLNAINSGWVNFTVQNGHLYWEPVTP